MSKAEIDIDVECSDCSASLDIQRTTSTKYGLVIEVAPCEKCIGEARDQGYEDAQNGEGEG